MKNRIEEKFRKLKKEKRKAISVFLTAGYPNLSATEKLVIELEKCGVDLFEIGLPFSDPMADGPVIQRSSDISLKKGTTWNKVISLCRKIRKKSEVPLILMSYANPLFARGWEKSARELSQAGFDGVIIPDIIPEENKLLPELFRKNGLSLVYMAAPTSPAERIKKICRASSGFVYCVSVTGVTGARKALPSRDIRSFAEKVKSASKLPVLLGFGVSSPEQVHEFKKSVDGFIIGSAMIKVLGEKKSNSRLIERARNFITPFIREASVKHEKKR